MSNMNDMIYIVGKGRVTKLVILALINIALAVGIYYYMLPLQESTQKTIRSVDSDNRRLRAEIDGMPALVKKYQENEIRYTKLLQDDFISDQDRIQARRTIDKVRQASNVLRVEYDISPITYEKDFRTSNLSHDIARSEISMLIGSSIDLESYGFLQLMEQFFPGLLVVKSINFEKALHLNEQNLIKIGQGEPVSFIEGDILFDWYTLVEKPAEQQQPQL